MAKNMNFFTEEELKEQQQAQSENIHGVNDDERIMWTSPEHKERAGKSKRTALICGVAVCILLALSAILWLLFRPDNEENKNSSVSSIPSVAQPTPEPTPEATPAPTPVPGPKVKADDWFAMLVNSENPIPEEYEMTDQEVIPGSGYWLDHRILEDYWAMVDAAKEADLQLKIVSAYRGNEVQQGRYNEQVRKLKAEGMDEETAKEKAMHITLPGGCSEHNLGLAVDLVSQNNQRAAEFSATPEYEWLLEHAANYGFIERYPAGKEAITGVEAKPYHWRYVGRELAEFLVEEGLTLDEYHSKYLN